MIRLTLVRDGNAAIEREVSADQALDVLALVMGSTPLSMIDVVERPSKKVVARAKKVEGVTHDDEGPAIKTAPDREAVKRLIKESDLSAAEIAEKSGCAASYVYMLRYAMKKAGEIE